MQFRVAGISLEWKAMTVRKKGYPLFIKEWVNEKNLKRVWKVLYLGPRNNESKFHGECG